MLGLLVAGLVLAQPTSGDVPPEGGAAPAPDAPAPPDAPSPAPPDAPPAPPDAPPDTPSDLPADAVFVPPALLAPLATPWPADFPAPLEATPAVVELELLVDEAGKVEEAQVVSGAEPFAGLALATAKAATFQPAMENGKPVAVVLPVRLEFAPPPVNVSGVVRLSGGRGMPAVGVPVTVDGRTVLTDAQGRFAFRGVRPGEQALVAGDEDVRVERQGFTVLPGEAVEMDLWGKPRKIDEGIVGTYRVERDEVVRRSLSAEEMRTTPGTLGDPLRAVANLPGTVRTPLDAGWLLVRGGDPRDTGVYIDGVRVPLVYHLGGFTSVVHPGFIERVDFYPGGQSARYGRATAGAVDLVTRPRPESLEVRGGLNIVLAGAYAAVPIGKKAGVTAAFRRSYLDAVMNAVPGVSAEQAAIAPRFWDWQFRYDHGPFEITGLGYVDRLDTTNADDKRSAVQVNTQRVHGAWHGDVAGKPVLVKPYLAYELNRLVLDVIDTDQLSQTHSVGVRLEAVDDQEGLFGWSAGVDGAYNWVGMRVNHVVERYAPVGSPDAYLDLRVGEDTRLIAGARLDTLLVRDQLPRAAASPRLAGELPVTDWLTFIGDAGVYHQPPPYNLVIGPPEGSTLQLERSYGAGAGARVRVAGLRFDLDLFNRRMDRMTAFESDGSLGQGEGAAYGVEGMLRYSRGPFSGWTSGGYSRSLRREEAGDGWSSAPYDQPFTFVAVGAFDLGRNWTLGSRWRWASGYPIGEIKEAYDILLGVSLDLEGERTEPFHSLDLKISKQVLWKRGRLDAYLDVQNVYNRRVAEPVISGIWEVYGTHTYGVGLPTLPILGVEGVFGRAPG